jgi:cyclopropane fatty-acyl-phospholipid synthase-like methyltransferase
MNPDISVTHMGAKGEFYWNDLVAGTTSRYKESVMHALIRDHFTAPCKNLIDIGCGTCETILKYKKLLGGEKVVCTDYDPVIVHRMQELHAGDSIDWRTADIFDLTDLPDTYDLVFLMDMIHEVYSFYGRPNRKPEEPIDHALGIEYVHRAFKQVTNVVNQNGGIILTDDVLTEEDCPVTVRLKRPEVIEAVKYLFANYSTRKFNATFRSEDVLEINSRDLCVLLTQYNKITQGNWARWNIERFETHQYMSHSEYDSMFRAFGFTLHAVEGTPDANRAEWNADVEVLEGLQRLPEKRITLLAIKD